MVSAINFYADADDTAALLKHLDFGGDVSLHPWPLVTAPATHLTVEQALAERFVMVRSRRLGEPVVLRDGDPAFEGPTRAALFNRLNREELRPGPASGGLVDSNRSPVIFWEPGAAGTHELRTSLLGSQADSMSAISADYERWVNRAMSWIRRRGTVVWGLKTTQVRPDLDIDLPWVNSVCALPGALRQLEAGMPGR